MGHAQCWLWAVSSSRLGWVSCSAPKWCWDCASNLMGWTAWACSQALRHKPGCLAKWKWWLCNVLPEGRGNWPLWISVGLRLYVSQSRPPPGFLVLAILKFRPSRNWRCLNESRNRQRERELWHPADCSSLQTLFSKEKSAGMVKGILFLGGCVNGWIDR